MARLGEIAQVSLSIGNIGIPKLTYSQDSLNQISPDISLNQLYQTVALRAFVFNRSTSRLMIEGSFRNNTVSMTYSGGMTQDKSVIDALFVPYFETPELGGRLQFDVSVISLQAGVKYYTPPQNYDPQLRIFGGLYFMAK